MQYAITAAFLLAVVAGSFAAVILGGYGIVHLIASLSPVVGDRSGDSRRSQSLDVGAGWAAPAPRALATTKETLKAVAPAADAP